MRKKKISSSFPPSFLIPCLNPAWFILAVGLWSWQQYEQGTKGIPLSGVIFAKGFLILFEAAVLYHLSDLKDFYFLGMFPLSWLAVSRFQWDLCAMREYRFWLWLAIFLGMEILILAMPNGKKLLLTLVPLWGGLIWLFKFSFLLPLAFLTAPRKRFPQANWVRWGGLAAATIFFIAFKGWVYFVPEWSNLFDIFVVRHFIAFFLLGCLGLTAFDPGRKGTFRHILMPLFLLTGGFLLWGGENEVSLVSQEILEWILIFAAGFGWETFRKYIMDSSWHGRAVWFVLGLAFFGGVL